MNQTINIKKAGTYYLLGNLFNKGIAFLTVPIFTRILSTYDYGIVTTYNSWIGIISMSIGFALHMAVRLAFVDLEEKIDEFMSTVVSFTILSSIALTLIICSGALLFKVNISIVLVLLCMLQGFSTAVIEDYIHYLMMQYRYRFRTLLMIAPNLVSVIFSIVAILFVFKTDRYLGRIIPTGLVSLLFGILVVLLVYRKSKAGINRKYLRYGLTISMPLIIHGIALNVLSQSDRMMISWLANPSQTGIYSLIFNFSMIATVLTSSLEGIWLPWFTEKMKNRKFGEINALSIDYINFMTYAMVCLLLVAPEIVKIMANETYWEGIKIIPPIVLANYVIFLYSLYVNIEHFYKHTIYITRNTIIAAIVNVLLNYIFIPIYGYVAAAYTTLAAYLISLILHAIYAKKLEPGLYPIRAFVRPIVLIIISTILFYIFKDYSFIRWTLMFLFFILMVIRERKRILEFFPELEQKIKLPIRK
ncbi:oligosaccharide flippase family protein [Anaerocolumna sp. AGMB13020]|uniref:oligosaccharide flippase family protein n=1 Tax=Anaerocolumna sp. AGMB13020 TaxID=3081750 RepID=UPI002955A426|nr:oligosaccharide flippase family protein [Anaerocolumna sp. AGMB13020]WOO38851.1 oligosaccharide flippase family protein [Anaerocolumna sp. AGMB13020]